MNRFLSYIVYVSAALLLVACGENSSTETQVVQESATIVVDSTEDLPDCGDENEGFQAYVKGETSVRICVDGKWRVLAGDTVYVNGKDFSCTTETFKDSSGVKIICNGDSIGVVLNGRDGKKGADGKDGKDGVSVSPDTLENDSEAVAVSLDSLTGFSQKGPFVRGAAVYLYELENGYTLKQTNGNFVSSITRDDGRYKFTARNLVSQYVMLLVDGNYRNEVTGSVSKNAIQLKAISNMRLHKTANVNILTHLEFERVYHLVTKDKLTVLQAKRKAQKEILSEFNIELEKNTDAEDMDVFGNSEADAALLALSILLQGDRTESGMLALLTEISNDMAEDGKWNGENADSIKAAIADWAFGQNLSKFRKNVEGWGLSKDKGVGDFEKFINNFIATVYGIKTCDGQKDSLQQKVVNQKSRFNGRSYQCAEKPDNCDKCEMWVDKREPNPYMNPDLNDKYGTMIDWRDRRMYYTIDFYDITCYSKDLDNLHYSGIWLAENLDFDYSIDGKSYGNGCYANDCEKYGSFGRYYTWAAAMDSAGLYSVEGLNCGKGFSCAVSTEVRGVCPEGWHLPSSEEWNALITLLRRNYGRQNADYWIKSKTGWGCEYCSDGNDFYGLSIAPAGYCSFEQNCLNAGTDSYLWSASEGDRNKAKAMILDNHDSSFESVYNVPSLDIDEDIEKNLSYSVRCIQKSSLALEEIQHKACPEN